VKGAGGWRGWLVNLSLSLAVTVVVAGGAEAVARWLEKPAAPRPLADTRGLDWDTEWNGDFYVVKSEAVGWPVQDVNADGLRDRHHPIEKPPHTFRLVCLGDSVTLGYGFPREEAWPQALQRMADARGPGLEAFNVALLGWSTRQERYAYERIARRYRPDAVVLAVVLNDLEDLHNNLSRPPPLLVELFKRSALVRRVVDAEGREIRSIDELYRQPEPAKVSSAFQKMFAELRALADDVRQDGARLAVMVLPDADQVAPSPPPPIPETRIDDFLRAEGVPVIDVQPGLRALGPSAFMDRLHLTPLGSARVAEAVLAATIVPAEATAIGPFRAALAAAGAPPEVERASAAALVALVADPSPDVRREAAWALGRRRPATPGGVSALALGLADGEASVRLESARALGALADGHPPPGAAYERLRALLHDPSESVRWAAADTLAASGAGAAADVPWLIDTLDNPDPYVRAFAAWTLGVAGPAASGAAPALVLRLKDPVTGVRTVAVRALGNIGRGDPVVVAGLREVLAHGEGEGRWRAARALGKLGPAAAPAAEALAAALSDRSEKLRLEAAMALDAIGPPAAAAVSALVAAEHDSDSDVRQAAQAALRRITASR
jgi:HEAT repeat protein/lysophospholipase L1-like esterase